MTATSGASGTTAGATAGSDGGSTAGTTDGTEDAAKRAHWWRSRWFQALVSIAVVVVIFGFVFPKVADYAAVWETIRDMTGLELASLVPIGLWNLASYWPLLVAVLPGLLMREAAASNLGSTAIANTVPGGAALGIGVTVSMLRSWGIPVPDIVLASVVSGIWNNFVKLGLPILALAFLALTGSPGAGLVTAALIGLVVLVAAIVIFALLLRSEALARSIGSLASTLAGVALRPVRRKPPGDWDERAVAFRQQIIGLLAGRSLWITLATVLSHLSLFLVLLVALRNVGVSEEEVSTAKALAGFAFVRLLSAIPLTPGGVGVVELGLTAALGAGLPLETRNQIAAAVLLFRAITWALPIPLGAACLLFWRANHSWRRTLEERETWAAQRHAGRQRTSRKNVRTSET